MTFPTPVFWKQAVGANLNSSGQVSRDVFLSVPSVVTGFIEGGSAVRQTTKKNKTTTIKTLRAGTMALKKSCFQKRLAVSHKIKVLVSTQRVDCFVGLS